LFYLFTALLFGLFSGTFRVLQGKIGWMSGCFFIANRE
jgi:hypothetical protein